MPPASHRLRLLLAIGIYQPEHGGAAEWLRHYARWLAGRGHEVAVVCERAETAASEPFAMLALPGFRHPKNSWKRAVALQNLVKQHPADIVHDTGCLLASDVFHPLMGSLSHNWHRQLRAYPPALRLRRFWHVRLWRDVRLQWRQCRRHRLLVACSRRVASDFARFGCRNPAIVPNGIRVPAPATAETIRQLRRKLNTGNRLLVLVTATNFYLKGVLTVLRALSRLDAPTREKFLVIITGHNPGGTFPQYLDRHRLHDCCRLTGWVEDIDDYYQAADIFLHPTYHDAGSLSTLKALAAGCAVVTTRFDGSADLIQDEVNGLILNQPGDAGELAKILRRLLNPELRNQLGTAARKLAPVIAQERQFQQLEALYFNLLPAKIRPA